MSQLAVTSVTERIEQKVIELSDLRRDMRGISNKLNWWKTLDARAKKLENEIGRLRAIRSQMKA